MLEIVIDMLLQLPLFGYTFSVQDRLMLHLVAILDDCYIGIFNVAAE